MTSLLEMVRKSVEIAKESVEKLAELREPTEPKWHVPGEPSAPSVEWRGDRLDYLQQIRDLPPAERDEEWMRIYGVPYSEERYQQAVARPEPALTIGLPSPESQKIRMLELQSTAALREQGYKVEEYFSEAFNTMRRKITRPGEDWAYYVAGEHRREAVSPVDEEAARYAAAMIGLEKMKEGRYGEVTSEEAGAIREQAAEELRMIGFGVKFAGAFPATRELGKVYKLAEKEVQPSEIAGLEQRETDIKERIELYEKDELTESQINKLSEDIRDYNVQIERVRNIIEAKRIVGEVETPRLSLAEQIIFAPGLFVHGVAGMPIKLGAKIIGKEPPALYEWAGTTPAGFAGEMYGTFLVTKGVGRLVGGIIKGAAPPVLKGVKLAVTKAPAVGEPIRETAAFLAMHPKAAAAGTFVARHPAVLKAPVYGYIGFAEARKVKIMREAGVPLEEMAKSVTSDIVGYAGFIKGFGTGMQKGLPLKYERVQPVLAEKPIYRGLILETKKVRFLVGKTPEGWQFGFPRISPKAAKIIYEPTLQIGYTPMSPAETALAQRYGTYGYAWPSRTLVTMGPELRGMTFGRRIPITDKNVMSKTIREVLERHGLHTPKAISKLTKWLGRRGLLVGKKTVYGSVAQEAQLPAAMRRIPHDIDVYTKNPAAAAKEAVRIIERAVGPGKVWIEGESLLVTKTGHFMDIHGPEEIQYLTGTGYLGFGFRAEPTITIGDIKAMSISEQATRKMVSTLTMRPAGVAAEPHRIAKDMADWLRIESQLITGKAGEIAAYGKIHTAAGARIREIGGEPLKVFSKMMKPSAIAAPLPKEVFTVYYAQLPKPYYPTPPPSAFAPYVPPSKPYIPTPISYIPSISPISYTPPSISPYISPYRKPPISPPYYPTYRPSPIISAISIFPPSLPSLLPPSKLLPYKPPTYLPPSPPYKPPSPYYVPSYYPSPPPYKPPTKLPILPFIPRPEAVRKDIARKAEELFKYRLYKHPLGDISELVWGKPRKGRPAKLPIAFLKKASRRKK